jgi:cell division control protein 6
VLDDNLDGRVKSSMGNEMILFPSYSKKELEGILGQRVKEAFKEGTVEENVVQDCANIIALESGDARMAIDLLRVSGEMASQKRSKVTCDILKAAFENVKKDIVQEILGDLTRYQVLMLDFIAFLVRDKDVITTDELYDAYHKAKEDMHNLGNKPKLSERRMLDILKDLETLGLIDMWNVSRGRKGYKKEVKLNVNPQTVLDYFLYTRKGFRLEISRAKSS